MHEWNKKIQFWLFIDEVTTLLQALEVYDNHAGRDPKTQKTIDALKKRFNYEVNRRYISKRDKED